MLPPARIEIYDRIASIVGNTPLGEIRHILIPRNNRIFFKAEYRNPTGSHYDRGMYRLLRHLEEEGDIQPGVTSLVETTTGNSGAAFAWTCRILGYQCKLLIPQDMPWSRIAHIKSFGAQVEYSPPEKYVRGLITKFRRYISQHKIEVPPDHASDEIFLVAGMEELGAEIVSDFEARKIKNLDYFICALGNGSSSRGVGTVLAKKYKTTLIGMEPLESPTVYARRFPEEYKQRFGNNLPSGKHSLIGTGPGEVNFAFPNMRAIEGELQKIILVRDEDWRARLRELEDFEGQHVGNTSAACLHAALEIAQTVSNTNMLVLFYDPAWKYLDISPDEASTSKPDVPSADASIPQIMEYASKA